MMTPEDILSQEIEALEKKIYDQQQLIEISRALSSTLDYAYLIEAVLDICMAHTLTLEVALFLMPEMDSDFILLVDGFKGFEITKPREKYRIRLNAPLIRYLEQNDSSLTIEEIEKTIKRDTAVRMLREFGAQLVVPLHARGKINGLIILGEKAAGQAYSVSERKFLIELANIGGIAVENADLFERASLDMMTGLKNHTFFQSRLREEWMRIQKRKSPLSLLFIDIDLFKRFNDTHGHQAGDQALKIVADAIIQARPAAGFAARYGGEEFCLLLPGVDEEEALQIAENLRRQIEQTQIPGNKRKLQVTLSIGVATMKKGDERGGKNILERADQALYVCKRSGRNRVQPWRKNMKSNSDGKPIKKKRNR